MVEVLLCQTIFDISHEYTFNFKSRQSQEVYFRNKLQNKTVICNSKCDAFLTKINIEDCSFEDLLRYDYLVISDLNGNKFFYFITGKLIKTKKVTELYLKLDVFQTYMFDYNIGKSFVERCHVNRWNEDGTPTNNNVDECLEYGSTIVNKKEDIYNFPLNYILVATSPIGKLNTNTQSNNNLNGGNPINGDVSYKYIRYLKGVEGLEKYPRNTGDGCTTFGFGITQENDGKFFDLMKPAPVSDKVATQVLIQSIKELYALPVANYFKSRGIDLNTMPTNHFDAFTDLCYNCGFNGFKKSPMVEKYIENVGYTNDIDNLWLNYKIMKGSTFENGLKYRRKTQLKILKDNVYENKTIEIYGGGTIEGDGYMPNNDIQSIGDKIVATAKTLCGKPYVFGGIFPTNGGTDCSGLCQYSYKQNGYSIPRTTYEQIKIGKEIQINEVKKGDLIFSRFNGTNDTPEHVFMYSGFNNNKHYCIEAKKTGTLISEHEFNFTQEMRIRRVI